MLNFISSLISTPDVTDEQRENSRRMLRNILITLVVTSSLIAVVDGVIFKRLATLYTLGLLAILTAISLVYLQRRVLWPARIITPLGALVAISYLTLVGNGLHDIAISSFGIVVILAGLTLGGNGVILFGIISALAIAVIGLLEINGYIAYPFGTVGLSDITIISISIMAGALLLRLLLNRLQQSITRLQVSEQEQIQANADLLELKNSLENRVQQRTSELTKSNQDLDIVNTRIRRRATQFEALAQVTRTITAIRDLQTLLPRITSVISDKFGFYHVGIFLLDEINQFAILSAANSEGGKRMLARSHRLRVGEEGIVGHTAATGKPRIAMDVGADAVFFNNPDLPDTHSEMALPLISKNIIVGALDVQSTEIAAFTKEDIQMLSLLADQVSLAIENARIFEDARKALAESEMISRRTTREAWNRLPEQQKLLGYRYNVAGSAPLKEPIKLSASGLGKDKDKQPETNRAVVPIALRGEVIGTLVVQSPTTSQWNEDQLDLIRAVAERVALSAENARLFEETTARAEREKMVSDITSKIRSHTDPQAMIQTAIDELRSALGASRVEVIPQSIKGSERNEA
jgi:GAF domain-containing protein